MFRRLLTAFVALPLATLPQASLAIEMAYRCSNVRGVTILSPAWEPDTDGFEGRSVLLHFTGKGLGTVTGFDGIQYPGFEIEMNGGFGILLFGAEFIETYAVNVSNQELMMTAIRTGSSTFPNSAKAFRGICKPAGNEIVR